MICQRCAKEKPGIHTCTPSDLVRELEQQRDELVDAALAYKDAREFADAHGHDEDASDRCAELYYKADALNDAVLAKVKK